MVRTIGVFLILQAANMIVRYLDIATMGDSWIYHSTKTKRAILSEVGSQMSGRLTVFSCRVRCLACDYGHGEWLTPATTHWQKAPSSAFIGAYWGRGWAGTFPVSPRDQSEAILLVRCGVVRCAIPWRSQSVNSYIQ